MYLINNQSTDPYYNLAIEEILFNELQNEYILFYRNSKSIIIGKHQNPYAECNLEYAKTNIIPVIRRISGGGTVFHDENNINFSIILNSESGKQVDFKKYTEIIIQYLESLGLSPELSKRGDILLNGFKISGNAEHIVKNRVLHHGTLLYNSNLTDIENSLNAKMNLNIESKAVRSVKSKVTNILANLKTKISVDEFIDQLTDYIYDNRLATAITLTNEQKSKISNLAKVKYKTKEWNYFYTPKFKIVLPDNTIIEIDKGYIRNIETINDENMLIYRSLLNKEFDYFELIKNY